jgi:hypothetical protein
MAKQVIGIGTTANDSTGDQVRVAFDKTNQNFTELYDAQLADSDDLTEGSVNLYNQTHTGEVTGSTSLTIADDVITYAKLANEFTASSALATNVDFNLAQVFTKTLTGNTTLTFSNAQVGMVKDLVITGNFTLTLPAGSTVAGEYDGTVSNLVQIAVTGANQYWYSISQPQ